MWHGCEPAKRNVDNDDHHDGCSSLMSTFPDLRARPPSARPPRFVTQPRPTLIVFSSAPLPRMRVAHESSSFGPDDPLGLAQKHSTLLEGPLSTLRFPSSFAIAPDWPGQPLRGTAIDQCGIESKEHLRMFRASRTSNAISSIRRKGINCCCWASVHWLEGELARLYGIRAGEHRSPLLTTGHWDPCLPLGLKYSFASSI